MKKQVKRSLLGCFHFDPLLVVVSFSLLVMGYVMVASSSLHLGIKITGNSFYYPIRQSLHIALGVTLGICDHAYIISDGRVLAEGTPAEIVNDADVRRVYLGEHFRM